MPSPTEAIVTIAPRDPALAAILLHQHECIEATKREVRTVKRILQWGVAAAGGLGTILGSALTIVVQHFMDAVR